MLKPLSSLNLLLLFIWFSFSTIFFVCRLCRNFELKTVKKTCADFVKSQTLLNLCTFSWQSKHVIMNPLQVSRNVDKNSFVEELTLLSFGDTSAVAWRRNSIQVKFTAALNEKSTAGIARTDSFAISRAGAKVSFTWMPTKENAVPEEALKKLKSGDFKLKERLWKLMVLVVSPADNEPCVAVEVELVSWRQANRMNMQREQNFIFCYHQRDIVIVFDAIFWVHSGPKLLMVSDLTNRVFDAWCSVEIYFFDSYKKVLVWNFVAAFVKTRRDCD